MSDASDDRNLLFGVLALQVDLIDAQRFAEVCTAWSARKERSLADLLVERGWLTAEDRADVERLLQRKLRKHGDAHASLAALAAADADVRRSLASSSGGPASPLVATVAYQPERLDRYTLTALHATGGIGQVWLARDHQLGRDVALKELRPDRDHDADNRGRFLQEAQITGQLEHPGVVPVYELARRANTGQPYYTMRFVKGRTLTDAARDYHDRRRAGREEAFALPALLNAFVTVCHTIAYAHSRGVLHRDLKGQNVLLGDFGEVVVLDWGLAKLLGRPERESTTPPVSPDREATGSDLTAAGQTLGTPAYMAPEQAAGQLDLINERTDVYGLGAILYELLTGQPPFTSPNIREVLRQVQEEEPPPPREAWPQVPAGLEAICLRALVKDQPLRWASATELGQQVQGWQEAQRREALEALQESEERFRMLADAIPQNVWTASSGSKEPDYFNRRAIEYTGLTIDELKHGGWRGLIHPDDLARVETEFALDTGISKWIEYRIRRADGQYRWHLSRAMPVHDAQGRVIRWFGTSTEIEDQKRTEDELRRAKERFELVVQASQDGLWDWDLITHEVYYSPRYKSMLGYEDHEFPNRAEEWHKRVHPEDYDRVRQELREHFKSREPLSWVEFRFRHKDGSYRWIRSRAYVLRDATGRVYRMAGSHEDITERKTAEEALRASEEQYHLLTDALPQIVWASTPDGRNNFWNRRGHEYSGLSASEAAGSGWHAIMHPDDLPRLVENWENCVRTGQPQDFEFRLRRATDGAYRWFLGRAVPVRDAQGQIVKWIGTCTDIDDKKCTASTGES